MIQRRSYFGLLTIVTAVTAWVRFGVVNSASAASGGSDDGATEANRLMAGPPWMEPAADPWG